MILALAILGCVVAMSIIFIGLLAYACVRVGTRAYPTKPGTCTHKNKDQT